MKLGLIQGFPARVRDWEPRLGLLQPLNPSSILISSAKDLFRRWVHNQIGLGSQLGKLFFFRGLVQQHQALHPSPATSLS